MSRCASTPSRPTRPPARRDHAAPGFKEAYAQFVEGGWTGLTARRLEAYGGQHAGNRRRRAEGNDRRRQPGLGQLPAAVARRHRSAEAPRRGMAARGVPDPHRRRQLDRHHVPDRAALRLRPRPAQDPRRTAGRTAPIAISGTKIFITAGEHDLTENIVHLVLARLPDAPPGTKGISLFIVPKFKVGARDGSLGERATRCAAAASSTRWASTARPPA
jgi:alkylation response protein AidB-like acyl-CoA dehydrogenase